MQVKFAFSLSRIYEHFGRGQFGIVSAYLGNLPVDENERRQEELKAQVERMGLGYREQKGFFTNEEGGTENEYSLFIPEAMPEDTVFLGREEWKPPDERSSQWSVIYADGPENIVYHELLTDKKKYYPKMYANFEKAWTDWSEYHGRPYKFDKASLQWHLPMPKGHPDSENARDYWRDTKLCLGYTRWSHEASHVDRVVIRKRGTSCK